MIPKGLKAMIDTHCMGIKDINIIISNGKLDLIYDKLLNEKVKQWMYSKN